MRRKYVKGYIVAAALVLIAAVGEFIRFFQVDSINRITDIGLGAVLLLCGVVFIFLYRFHAGRAHNRLREERQADHSDKELPKLTQKQPQPKDARDE